MMMKINQKLRLEKTKKIFLLLITLVSVSLFSAFIINSIKPQNISSPAIHKSSIPLKKPQLLNIRTCNGCIQPNEPITTLLSRNDIPYSTILQLIKDTKPVYNLKYIRSGHKYEIAFKNHQFYQFKYSIDPEKYLLVKRNQKGFEGKIEKVNYITKTTVIRGIINSTLFESIKEINEQAALADHLASIFEYDVDFNRDIQKGDSYTILIEKKYLKNKFIKYGDIRSCELINQKKRISIIRYTDPKGKTAYYHPNGRAVKKMFLKCPLPFMRVSSRYGNRIHPILKFSAKHYGIDLMAKPGTKIRSTANGFVFKTGYDKNKGRFIIIRHPNQYFTHYYHLSKIQKRIFRGRRVTQGQIIGYVGSTGLSTGPHLHYGMKKKTRFLNPLKYNTPNLPPVNKAFLKDFYLYQSQLTKFIDSNTPFKFHDLKTNLGIIKVSPNYF